MARKNVIIGFVVVMAVSFLILGGRSTLFLKGPGQNKSSTQVNKPVVASGTFFSIKDKSGKEGLELNVYTTADGKKYKADIKSTDMWKLIYVSPNVCFRKSTFVYTYCINEKISGLNLVRLMLGVTSTNSGEGMDLNDAEKNTASWTPTNALAAFLSHIELALVDLRIAKLVDGDELKVNEGGGPSLNAGVISDVRSGSEEVEIPIEALDLGKLSNTIIDKQLSLDSTIPLFNLENSDGDKRIIRMMGEFGIDPENFLIK
ncbi:MAG: hypothetical protein AAB467_03860 [Patescibacteria group bacterium]